MNYLKVFGIEEEISEGLCPVTAYYLITDYFEVTLFDIFRTKNIGKFFFKEADLWNFLFYILEVLDFNRVRNINR